MCFGCPSVSTRVGGIPELVEDGESGLLVPSGDVGALAGALQAYDKLAQLGAMAVGGDGVGRCSLRCAWVWRDLRVW